MSTMEQEVAEIRTAFESYKETTNDKLDKIFEKLKPQFSSSEITTFLLSILGVFATIMIYVTTIKSDARNNATEIRNVKEDDITLKETDERIQEQFTEILEKLSDIQIEQAKQK